MSAGAVWGYIILGVIVIFLARSFVFWFFGVSSICDRLDDIKEILEKERGNHAEHR